MKKQTVAAAAVIVLLTAVLVTFSSQAREGAVNGMHLCGDIIIPSLLPVLTCGNLLMLSDAGRVAEKMFGGIAEKWLRLPRPAASAVLLGMVCGYPAGAVLTASLYGSGQIGSREAKRMMRFNFSGGAAFIITAVGSGVYHSTKAGAVLLAISVLSSLLTAAADAFVNRKTAVSTPTAAVRALPLSEALPAATENTVRALAVMSAYIVIFSAFLNLLAVPPWLLPLIEITGGVCTASPPLPLPYAAFFISFGGLCIHLQLIGFLKKMRVPYITFLSGRLCGAVLSFLLAKLYVFLFPEQCTVFSNLSAPQAVFSESGIAPAAVMLVGCAVIIFDIENRKLKSA